MLVLQRREGQSLVIGDVSTGDVVVVGVSMIDRQRVKLTIQAPPDIHIVRAELLTVMQQAILADHGFTLDIEENEHRVKPEMRHNEK